MKGETFFWIFLVVVFIFQMYALIKSILKAEKKVKEMKENEKG